MRSLAASTSQAVSNLSVCAITGLAGSGEREKAHGR
jgi:hypothetical protein